MFQVFLSNNSREMIVYDMSTNGEWDLVHTEAAPPADRRLQFGVVYRIQLQRRAMFYAITIGILSYYKTWLRYSVDMCNFSDVVLEIVIRCVCVPKERPKKVQERLGTSSYTWAIISFKKS